MMQRRKPPFPAVLSATLAALAVAVPLRAEIPATDHLDCAANYGALSLALPYLPGIFLMFAIAPRTGQAQRIYHQTTPPDEQLPRNAVIAETERRKQAIMAAFREGTITLEEIIATAHACDDRYGFDHAPLSLDDMLRPR